MNNNLTGTGREITPFFYKDAQEIFLTVDQLAKYIDREEITNFGNRAANSPFEIYTSKLESPYQLTKEDIIDFVMSKVEDYDIDDQYFNDEVDLWLRHVDIKNINKGIQKIHIPDRRYIVEKRNLVSFIETITANA